MNDDDDDDGGDCDDEDEKCRNDDCGSLIFWLVVDNNIEDNEVCCEQRCWQRIAEMVLVRCVHGDDAWQTRSRETNDNTFLIVGKFCRTTTIWQQKESMI